MNLNINKTSLILEVPEVYYLDIKLHYEVNESEGTAKFDPKNKKLKITLPITIR